MTLDGVDLSDGLFLRFVPRATLPGRSTPVVEVRNKKTSELEAVIKWRGRRGFSLHSEPGKMFGTKCLRDVIRVIDSLNQAHSNQKTQCVECGNRKHSELFKVLGEWLCRSQAQCVVNQSWRREGTRTPGQR